MHANTHLSPGYNYENSLNKSGTHPVILCSAVSQINLVCLIKHTGSD